MNCWTFTEFASINFLWCFWSLAPSNSCHHFSDDRQRTFFWMHFTACKRKDCAFICSMAENIFNIMLSFWKMSCLEYKGRRSMLHSYKVPILNHSLLLKPRNKWKAVFNPFGGFIKEFRGGSIMLTSCKWYKKVLICPLQTEYLFGKEITESHELLFLTHFSWWCHLGNILHSYPFCSCCVEYCLIYHNDLCYSPKCF